MTELKTIQDIVYQVLLTDEKARDSFNYLYIKVAEIKSPGITTKRFDEAMTSGELPSFESVRRTRQKLQAAHEGLRASDPVQDLRTHQEEIYRKYAIE